MHGQLEKKRKQGCTNYRIKICTPFCLSVETTHSLQPRRGLLSVPLRPTVAQWPGAAGLVLLTSEFLEELLKLLQQDKGTFRTMAPIQY